MIGLPSNVPTEKHTLFLKRYTRITHNTEHLFLFAADQKMEHLNDDFFGPNIPEEVNHPEHIFSIAQQAPIGAFATHLGLITRYAQQYRDISYIVKLNGKTHLSKTEPYSKQLWSIQDVLDLEKNIPHICGVGYTIYLGSHYEKEMLTEAAQIIQQAHQHGLIAILWIYPRGKDVANERSPELIAGAAGVAASLGADFVKVHQPEQPQDLYQAVQAAGTTKVIVSGGTLQDPQNFLELTYRNLIEGKVAGMAVGRNIFQHSLSQALALTHALAALIYNKKNSKEAYTLYKEMFNITL